MNRATSFNVIMRCRCYYKKLSNDRMEVQTSVSLNVRFFLLGSLKDREESLCFLTGFFERGEELRYK